MRRHRIILAVVAALGAVAASTLLSSAQASAPAPPAEAVPELAATPIASYDAFDANQGVAVDRKHFYAVDNQTITKHDRSTGAPLLQFAGRPDGPIEHMDSGAVVDGKLYVGHSNYPEWPMESSIEVFDARTMRHVGTHSFGIYRGSLTWLDRHDGSWWATFANYNRIQDGQTEPYGKTYNTQVVKLDNDFQVVQSWTIPKAILDRFELMSNSGGSWGPDGRLWLTGHDLAEAYVMQVPPAGGELEWIATVRLPGIEGQGIAWDRAGSRSTLWGISRENARVVRFSLPWKDIPDTERTYWDVLGPGEFQQ
jgi:hypothetical protein